MFEVVETLRSGETVRRSVHLTESAADRSARRFRALPGGRYSVRLISEADALEWLEGHLGVQSASR